MIMTAALIDILRFTSVSSSFSIHLSTYNNKFKQFSKWLEFFKTNIKLKRNRKTEEKHNLKSQIFNKNTILGILQNNIIFT